MDYFAIQHLVTTLVATIRVDGICFQSCVSFFQSVRIIRNELVSCVVDSGSRAPRCCASSCWPSRSTGWATWWGSPWRRTCCSPSSPSPTCQRWTAGCRRSCGWCSAASAGWERTGSSPGTLPDPQADQPAPQRAARSASRERWQWRRHKRSEETQVVTVQGTSHTLEMLWDHWRKEEIQIFKPRPLLLPGSHFTAQCNIIRCAMLLMLSKSFEMGRFFKLFVKTQFYTWKPKLYLF